MQVLGKSPGGRVVSEGDNEDKYPAAIHAKHRLGRYPLLSPGDEAPAYHRLWAWILNGAYESGRSRRARVLLGPGARDRIFEGRPDMTAWAAAMLARNPRPDKLPDGVPENRRVVAKSIHAQLSLDWLAANFDVEVLVLLRHPADVLASWMGVKLKDSRNSTLETRPDIRARYVERWGVPLPGPDPVEQMSWRIGLLLAALEEAMARNPSWHVWTHEQLCEDPPQQFRKLYADLDLPWSDVTDQWLLDHDTPGEGFVVNRVASELSGSWQRKLDAAQVATLRRVLAWFPISTWTDADFVPTGGPDQ
jgi:hypothetical protein